MFKRKELAEIPYVKPIAAETKKQRAKEGKQRSKQLRRSAKQSEMNAAQSARSIKKRRAPEKAADCLQYERMYESGICEVEPGLFSMTMAFTDVNFQLARQEEQKSLFTQYLTAPVGFSQHVIVYLQNLYTDDVYDLELYESNGLAAVEPNVLSGKYAFLSACVVGDAENRYQFSCEQNELSTETGADFHLTVTDTASPDREMNTSSRDQNSTVQAANSFNNRDTAAPEHPAIESEVVSQPVKQQEKQLDLLSLLLDFMPVMLVGAVLFAVRRKRRH